LEPIEGHPNGVVFDFVRTWRDSDGRVQEKSGREWLRFGGDGKLKEVRVEAK
jgi:hypothetical protein